MAGDLMPFFAMVVLQIGYAGMNITSKLAMQSGMNPLVLVAYRQMFATLAIAPFAFWMERKTRPKLTISILSQILLCSLTGATGNQVFYFLGLKYSSPTIACALSNILPAATFLLAVIFRQESVGIKTKAGVAKVVGTIVCVSGAMLLSFYHGHQIGLGESGVHWTFADKMGDKSSVHDSNHILGSLFLVISSVSWAAWFVIQARVNEQFAVPYTSTVLTCFMASIQCGVIALCFDHDISAWSLKSNIRLVGALYAGVVCSGIAFCVTSWCIQRKGPLYASVFSPLLLVIVAVLSWALLREKLYVGTATGSFLIVLGLYAVLWGKTREMKLQYANAEKPMTIMTTTKLDNDLEWQLYMSSNDNHRMTSTEMGEVQRTNKGGSI